MEKAKGKLQIKTRTKTKVIAFRVSETNFDLIKEYADTLEYNKSDILRKLTNLVLLPEILKFNNHIKN